MCHCTVREMAQVIFAKPQKSIRKQMLFQFLLSVVLFLFLHNLRLILLMFPPLTLTTYT